MSRVSLIKSSPNDITHKHELQAAAAAAAKWKEIVD